MTRIFFNETVARKRGFWRRQFGPLGTDAQDKFDLAFAIVLPTLCFVADPVIFKRGFFGPPFLQDYQLGTYLVSSVEMGLFLAWRTFMPHLRAYSAPLAGAFFAAALFSAVIGFAILPVSLIGLMVAVGIFGFTPFFTAFVFLRHGVRALKGQLNNSFYETRFLSAALSGVMVIALPVLATIQIERTISASVATIISGDAVQAEMAADRLKWVRFIPTKYCNQIADAYAVEFNPIKRDALARIYKDLTGVELVARQRNFGFD